MSKLEQLAGSYRLMPHGGARLMIAHPEGRDWCVHDGMTGKAWFLTEKQAKASLRVAGFVEIEPGIYKLAQVKRGGR